MVPTTTTGPSTPPHWSSDRKILRPLIVLNIFINFTEIAVIVALLIYSTKDPDPQSPNVREWRSCNKRLGILDMIWAVIMTFQFLIALWNYSYGFSSTPLIKRIIVVSMFVLTLAWFIASSIFVYTSVHSCRLAAPLTWWVTFVILLLIYIPYVLVLISGFIFYVVYMMASGDSTKSRDRTINSHHLYTSWFHFQGLSTLSPPEDQESTIETGGSGVITQN